LLLKSTILEIIKSQKNQVVYSEKGLKRVALSELPDLRSHALIVSGIRRCGKSTLLFQLIEAKYPDAIYLNFEDPRLYEFEKADFGRLDEVIKELGGKVLLFDEIQIFPDWEKYIRFKLDEGYQLIVTGSNASLLSKELGTKLTGRHITKELFPFSYNEFLEKQGLLPSPDTVEAYLHIGGFPEYVKHKQPEILQQLLEDILLRDIVVRYAIRDVRMLQRLAWYLISNVGKAVSGNRIKSLFEIKSTSTIMEYLTYLENAYLVFYVPKFSYSTRKQLINPRKVYAIDPGIIQVNSGSFSDDSGRELENTVFLHLKRKWKEIFYYSEKGECDFVVFDNGKIISAIQVCYQIDQDNMQRELNGLYDALAFFNLKKGYIITLNQDDHFRKDHLVIECIPAHKWLN